MPVQHTVAESIYIHSLHFTSLFFFLLFLRSLMDSRRSAEPIKMWLQSTAAPPPLLGARGTFISMWLFSWPVAGLQRSGEPLSECDTFGGREEVNRLDVGTWVSSRAEAFRVTTGRLHREQQCVATLLTQLLWWDSQREILTVGAGGLCRLSFLLPCETFWFWEKKKKKASAAGWYVWSEPGLWMLLLWIATKAHICPVILANREKPSLLQLLWSSNILSALELQNVHGCVCVPVASLRSTNTTVLYLLTALK